MKSQLIETNSNDKAEVALAHTDFDTVTELCSES